MNHLDHPNLALWEGRRQWFEAEMEKAMGNGMAGYSPNEQACALCADLQACFCAGAWVAVLIIAAAIVEGSIRDEVQSAKSSAYQLIREFGDDPDLHWLRKRRNQLIHTDIENPAITVDQQWEDRSKFEQEARRAICLTFKTMFMFPFL